MNNNRIDKDNFYSISGIVLQMITSWLKNVHSVLSPKLTACQCVPMSVQNNPLVDGQKDGFKDCIHHLKSSFHNAMPVKANSTLFRRIIRTFGFWQISLYDIQKMS